jgi:hypothetical protein
MEYISALFDRRCRTQTALEKLRKLRQWVKRFKWLTFPIRDFSENSRAFSAEPS